MLYLIDNKCLAAGQPQIKKKICLYGHNPPVPIDVAELNYCNTDFSSNKVRVGLIKQSK